MDINKLKSMAISHYQESLRPINDNDRQIWNHVSNLPKVSMPVAAVSMLLNIIFPGIGTWVLACAGSEDTISKV